jgi:hypothetical protein
VRLGSKACGRGTKQAGIEEGQQCALDRVHLWGIASPRARKSAGWSADTRYYFSACRKYFLQATRAPIQEKVHATCRTRRLCTAVRRRGGLRPDDQRRRRRPGRRTFLLAALPPSNSSQSRSLRCCQAMTNHPPGEHALDVSDSAHSLVNDVCGCRLPVGKRTYAGLRRRG